MRPHVRLAVVLAGTCLARAAHAQQTGVAVRIDCPALGAETHAVLEARARAELASEQLPGGELDIDCAVTSARIGWRPAVGPPGERTVGIEGDPIAAVDPVLEAIHALVVAAETAETPALLAPPATSGRDEPPETRRAPRDTDRARWAIVAGADSELWQGGIAGAIGAHAGANLWLGGRWSVVLLAGPAWGVDTAAGLRAWRVRGVARVEYAPAPLLLLGVGASARMLWADATRGTSPEQQGTSAGGLVSARYGFAVGPLAIGAGPEIEALLRPVSVQAAGVEVFRMPSVIVGVSIDASTR